MSGHPTRAPTHRSPHPVVDVVGVGHDVPGRAGVLHDVFLQVWPGELVVVAGRSGSGKSTLCHLVAGVGTPTRGTVTVLGRPAHDWADWTRVTLLPQRLALVPELSVEENVTWPYLLAGVRADPSPLLEALALTHLSQELTLNSSLGEQQRTALARALASRPDLAVLDEPTGHQDDANIERILAALTVRDPSTAVLVATHDDRLLALADRVITLDGGRTVGLQDRAGVPPRE
jgi:ABC-type lipoprotein export system ATPase subunit